MTTNNEPYFKAYLATLGGDEKGFNTTFGAVCEDNETAKRVAHKRGAWGSDNRVEEVFVIRANNGEMFLTGNFGLYKGIPRPITVLDKSISDKDIENHLEDLKNKEVLLKALSKLSDEEMSVLTTHIKNK